MIDLQAQDNPQPSAKHQGRTMSRTVDIPQSVKDSIRKFRFARRNSGSAALVVKVNKAKFEMEEVETFDEISIEGLVEELPEHAPRIVVLSCERHHEDGRKSFPLIIVNWIPKTSEIGLLTLHATAYIDFQQMADVSKTFEARESGDLTKEAIDNKLSTF